MRARKVFSAFDFPKAFVNTLPMVYDTCLGQKKLLSSFLASVLWSHSETTGQRHSSILKYIFNLRVNRTLNASCPVCDPGLLYFVWGNALCGH